MDRAVGCDDARDHAYSSSVLLRCFNNWQFFGKFGEGVGIIFAFSNSSLSEQVEIIQSPL